VKTPYFEEFLHLIAQSGRVIGFDQAAEDEQYSDQYSGCLQNDFHDRDSF
jgi:hypothetical protein